MSLDIIPVLAYLQRAGGSDLHLRVNLNPVIRVYGRLLSVAEFPPVTSEDLEGLMGKIMDDKRKSIFMAKGEVDFTLSVAKLGRFRVSFFLQRGTFSMVARSVPFEVKNFTELGLPDTLPKICEMNRGLILVTGTAGSGKSTTLASMIDHINSTRNCHIITIEDPIEYLHRNKSGIISQREVGEDTESYATALRSVVRQDPNVILIGETRDLETMSTALTAAETGHLVLTTLHTINAVQTINRIIDFFPPHQQAQVRVMLSNSLRAVISQRLLPSVTGSGMVPACEILVATPFVRKLFEENNMAEIGTQIKQGAYYGMQTFNQSLSKLLAAGKVDEATAISSSDNPEELMLEIRGITSDGAAGR